MTKECRAGKTSQYTQPNFRTVFERIHSILEFGVRQNENPSLGTLMFSLFEFINEALQEESLREMLRDEYGLLYYVSQIFNPALPPEESELILRTLERVTRAFAINWKAPYLKLLVQKIIAYITANFVSSTQTHLAFQFLVNICRKNSCCLMIVRFDPGYKEIWKLLGEGLRESKNQKTDILIQHLYFLLNPNRPADSFAAGGFMCLNCIQVLNRAYNYCANYLLQYSIVNRQSLILYSLHHCRV